MLGHMMQAPELEDLMDPFVMNGSLPMGRTMASKLPLISVVGNNLPSVYNNKSCLLPYEET